MHPALIALIIIGVPLGGWAAYEGAQYVHEWWKARQERKQYEEYVRSHYMNEKGSSYSSDDKHLFDTDDENDDDEKPLMARNSSNVWGRQSNDLRNRRRQGGWEHYKMTETELFELEKSIQERRMFLEQERAMLDKVETDLERQRQSIQSRGNSLMGMPFNNHSITTNNNSVESSSSLMTQVPNQQQHWNFAHPPPPPSPPQGTPIKLDMEESDFAMLRSHNMMHEEEEEDKLRMPSPPMHARNESDESSWADVSSDHHREQSDASDLSFNSIKTSSGLKSDSSYGVRSISSDEGSF